MIKTFKYTKFKILRNKKGFTMIEVIAVIALMAILAVFLGSFIANTSSFYTKEKSLISNKEISKVIEKEIRRVIIYKENVYLQDIVDNGGIITCDIPGQGNIFVDTIEYIPGNKPNNDSAFIYSDPNTGLVMFNNKFYDINSVVESYFGASSSETAAFYNNMKVDLKFKAIGGGNGKYQSLLIIADIKDKNDKVVYESQGTIVEFKNLTKTGNDDEANEINNFSVSEFVAVSRTYNYRNMINGIDEYTCLLFV